jgi:hypothetical protein
MNYTLDDINLPEGLSWFDKYKWNPVGQTVNISIPGSIIVQESLQLQGRPITLSGGINNCWCTKSLLDTIYGKLSTPELEMTLNLLSDGTHTVIWDRSEPIKTDPFIPSDDHTDFSMFYIDSLKFIKVG